MSDADHFPELAEKLRLVREQVRRRVERASEAAPAPPALQPLNGRWQLPESLAEAVGTLNPRPAGLVNGLAQGLKRAMARLSDWQFRPQRAFNRAVLDALANLKESLDAAERNFQALRDSLAQRDQWQQAAGQSVARDVDALCEQITLQRWAYEGALLRHANATEQVRQQLQALNQQLQQLRQRVAGQAKAQATRAEAAGANYAMALPVDYWQLELHFRGTEEEIRRRQRFYLPFFKGRSAVLDIACGRGEFLELLRDAGIPAKGVDLDADMVACCLGKGLDVAQADVFSYLDSVPDGTLGGIFTAQFVEHLEPRLYLQLIAQCAAKLAPGGVLAIETQNPECLAIFSQSFYLDPTHVRPIPPAQLRFALIEAGLERVTTHMLSPAAETLPLLPPLPAGALEPDALQAYNMAVKKFNETFFGGMDYAVIGYRPERSA
ncbi:MAG TPA: class I SAM-dependent methyltransferase [Terriglobia bacterium]|nr:class I SAM-dependent methyltransferase [Terriglobia bacterium]